jgi:hypothetical protein
MPAYVTKPEAFSISEIKSTIMDRLHMGGSFLQQVPTVTVGGLPVAIKQGGSLGSLGSALSDVTAAVQAAGDIAVLVQNPMAAVETALSSSIGAISSEISGVSGKLTGGQLSALTSAIGSMGTTLGEFQAHTSNLSGLSSAISDVVPDFSKITDLGNNLVALGSDTRDNFVQNTATALFSDRQLTDIKDSLDVTVKNKLEQIKSLDSMTVEGQAAIATLVTDITTLLNSQTNTIDEIVVTDTHNYNESGNNLTASTSVTGLAEQFSDENSVSYTLLNRVGKESTLSAFNSAITESTQA